jgi:hypothetical protein
MQDFVYLVEAHYGYDDMAFSQKLGCCTSASEAADLICKLEAYVAWHGDAERPGVSISEDADFETVIAAEEAGAGLWEMQAHAKMYELGLTHLDNVIDLFSVVEYNPDVMFSFVELQVFQKSIV